MPSFMVTRSIARNRFAFLRSGWFWILTCLCAGAVAVAGAISLYNRSMLERDVDHLFRHVLAEGNVATAYQHADANFRAMVQWPDFFAVAQDQPHWFERKHLHGVEVVWMMQGDNLYVVMKTRVDGSDVNFYCKPGERGNWR